MPIIAETRPTLFKFAETVDEKAESKQIIAERGVNRALLESVRRNSATTSSSFTALRRDLVISYHNRQAELSFALWRFNPLAKRIINTYVDFIVSDGIRPVSEDKATQRALDEYWDHPYNRWDAMMHRRVRDLLIYGELLHSATVVENGNLLLGAFQPTLITDIKVLDRNHEIATSIRYFQNPAMRTEEKEADLIRPTFSTKTGDFTGYNEGDFFLFGINQTTDSPRGVGELFTIIDHVDVLDDMLFQRALKVASTSQLWWDLQMEGYTEDQIKNYLATATNLPPEPGTVWAHNDRAMLELKTAPTNADDYSKDVAAERSHILGAAALPGTWVDAPGSAGRAVGAEMAEGTYKAIVSLQKQLAGMIRYQIDFMLYQKKERGLLDPKPYIVRTSSPSVRDLQRNGSALHRIAQALRLTWEAGFITTSQGASFMVDHMNEVGVSGVPLVADPVEEEEAPLFKLKTMGTSPEDDEDDDDDNGNSGGGPGREPSTNDGES